MAAGATAAESGTGTADDGLSTALATEQLRLIKSRFLGQFLAAPVQAQGLVRQLPRKGAVVTGAVTTTRQSCIVQGLALGTHYYAMKTYDELWNVSAPANPARAK